MYMFIAHLDIYTKMCIHTYIYITIYMYICVCVYVLHPSIHTHIHMHMHTYVRTHAHVCIPMTVSEALGAGGPELRGLVAGAALRRQGELDGPRPPNCWEFQTLGA